MGIPAQRIATTATSTSTVSFNRIPTSTTSTKTATAPSDLSVLILRPLDVPEGWAAQLPEGKIVTIENPALTLAGNPRRKGKPSLVTTPLAGGANAALNTINRTFMANGFTTIPGGNSIGLIGMSSWDLARPGAVLESPLTLPGHTAMFVRMGDKIVVVRGYATASWIEAALRYQEVFKGSDAIDAKLSNDVWLFRKTGARAIEWPVTSELALKTIEAVPEAGIPPAGGPVKYTGRAQVYARLRGVTNKAVNCVNWACSQVECALGGRVGTVGPDGKAMRLTEPSNPKAGLQGEFMKFTKKAARTPEVVAPMPETIGPPVVSGMPPTIEVVIWANRLFIVIGAGMVVYESYQAAPGQRLSTFVQGSAMFGASLVIGEIAAEAGAGLGTALGCSALTGTIIIYAGIGLLAFMVYEGHSLMPYWIPPEEHSGVEPDPWDVPAEDPADAGPDRYGVPTDPWDRLPPSPEAPDEDSADAGAGEDAGISENPLADTERAPYGVEPDPSEARSTDRADAGT